VEEKGRTREDQKVLFRGSVRQTQRMRTQTEEKDPDNNHGKNKKKHNKPE